MKKPKAPTHLDDELFDIAMWFARDCGTEALGKRDFDKIQKMYVKFAKDVTNHIATHYTKNSEVEELVRATFAKSTYQNIDGDAKYWDASGDYNKQAMDKFFPQEWLDRKFIPTLLAQLNTNKEKGA